MELVLNAPQCMTHGICNCEKCKATANSPRRKDDDDDDEEYDDDDEELFNATKQAAGASYVCGHDGCLTHAMDAADALKKRDYAGAARSHGLAARAHARAGNKTNDESHHVAGSLHRRASLMYSQRMPPVTTNEGLTLPGDGDAVIVDNTSTFPEHSFDLPPGVQRSASGDYEPPSQGQYGNPPTTMRHVNSASELMPDYQGVLEDDDDDDDDPELLGDATPGWDGRGTGPVDRGPGYDVPDSEGHPESGLPSQVAGDAKKAGAKAVRMINNVRLHNDLNDMLGDPMTMAQVVANQMAGLNRMGRRK
jgi:hypothetical protein